ncbi:hypothetical protein [Tepidiforma thermophila]|uniref:Uncharacterized protein n=1 Tax=Tepidiforma thermophila (strain KCTC 52669 / CGMCC 1.13589 / G233) TaxID=2761530 RepID=A0A2A9HAB4_TEPT2|nr:hypothetical protein [Tepidiforma thermophila]PFG72874.1 hypothetical protein A9A59_0067 [Tepidiforma thermophila]
MYPDDDDDRIPLGPPADDRDLGPDERDRDLMDGTWEQQYYSGQLRTRDWNTIALGIAILVVLALVLPMLLVVFR